MQKPDHVRSREVTRGQVVFTAARIIEGIVGAVLQFVQYSSMCQAVNSIL